MSEGAEEIKQAVRAYYGARGEGPCCTPQPGVVRPDSCCSGVQGADCHAQRLYSCDDLENLLETVTDISLGCGNPTALAELRPGEVVLDLGSGGGLDCFLAAQKVGEDGRVIGLDMTPEMVRLARLNAQEMRLTNVEFRLGEMENMPLADASVDIVISNCVVNLSPDKDAVFCEAYRVLRPGGRLCVSDMVWLGDPPPGINSDPVTWASCVGGALKKEDYLDKVQAAGFREVTASEPAIVAEEEVEPSAGENARLASIYVRAVKPF